ncbi:hypothetical protein BD770DRAFT_378372 [Pilaira anomala]|nr:hypothetical protein BD770DRAFT_378372 [Pilaira anomala]
MIVNYYSSRYVVQFCILLIVYIYNLCHFFFELKNYFFLYLSRLLFLSIQTIQYL